MENERKLYIVNVSFYQPNAGPIEVWATDEEHAKEMAKKLLPQVKDLEVLDVCLYDSMKKPTDFNPPDETPKVIN